MKKLSIWALVGLALKVKTKIKEALKDGGIDALEAWDIMVYILKELGVNILNKHLIKG